MKNKENMDMREKADNLDFGKDPVGRLFRKMLIPNLLGMVSMVVLNISDGAFVGHGAGSDAIAAVNIAAPIFMLITGIGLMFGIGGSVAAAIHLSRKEEEDACLCMTHSFIGGVTASFLIGGLILLFPERTCTMFGSSGTLLPLASMYIRWIAAFMPLCVIETIGSFAIRLDGSPKFAAGLSIGMAAFNIVLDYILVFPFHLGLKGAAMATGISFALSGIVALSYILFFSRTIKLYRVRMTGGGLMNMVEDLGKQVKIGFSGLLGELAIASLIVMGNYQFMKYLGDDGVAAYSVACYCTPIIFMLASSIVQSSQPIFSFAYGAGRKDRIFQTLRVCIRTSLICSVIVVAILVVFADFISSVFLPAGNAHDLCSRGLPLFSAMTVFVVFNVVTVGFNQSIENAARATAYTILRGLVFMVPAFIALPRIWGTNGLWTALAVSEGLTSVVIIATETIKGVSVRLPR